MVSYEEFLRAKVQFDRSCGFQVQDSEIHPLLKPHQRDIVRWAVAKGRAAIFAAFGLGKTFMQLEAVRLLIEHKGGEALIVAPLGVRQEFKRDAEKLGQSITFIRTNAEVTGPGLYLTNYESIRDGKIDPRKFTVVSLDEASILRGFGGTKTFRELMAIFEASGIYRFVATATPSPNEYIELLAYAAFLDVMDVGQAKTRFFKRNSEKADSLTIHPHKEREFWLWVSSWAIFLQRPSDLGYSDEGYELPPMEVHWHEVPSDHTEAGTESGGQARLLRNSAIGLSSAAREKRDSLPARLEKLLELRKLNPSAHRLIWHDLESERQAIEESVPEAVTVWGSQNMEERERALVDFSDGKIPELATKPVIAGSGSNFQRFCSWEIFLGIGFKFNDFIQAIHRCYRFLQTEPVRVDLIYSEAEREIRRVLEDKWQRHKELTEQMTKIIREYGLAVNAIHSELSRQLGVTRDEESGEGWRAIHNDTVLELPKLDSDSVGLVLTSIPFSTQYEYTPSYHDFGHTDSNEHFWQQMDFLIPELFRVLQPGRVAAIHVKDRIVPSGLTKMGFQTVYPFSDDTIRAFKKHGFGFLARKTIVTDVVRENNQTYRLGWTEQCKDGSRMGAGMPEYLLLFRKPPTDTSNGYADLPVVKSKQNYSRSRWQIDAHGFMRSSGDRLLSAADLQNVPHERIFKLYREHSLTKPYDYEHHIALSESLESCRQCGHIHTGDKCCTNPVLAEGCLIKSNPCECKVQGGILPTTFMLLQPQSWHPDVWTDIARMRSLNALQSSSGKEMHLCPLQFDICDRVINQFTIPEETVLDPFGGLMTVPYCAVKLGRKGIGIELSPTYWRDGVSYLKAIEKRADSPTLFDLVEAEAG
jgi:DNA modification methylase